MVFDLINGVSSSHSNRQFDVDTDYTIYLRVSSQSAALSTNGNETASWGIWQGGNELGAGDKIVLVGNGQAVEDNAGNNVAVARQVGSAYLWQQNSQTVTEFAAKLTSSGHFMRQWNNHSATLRLWDGRWDLPNNQLSTAQVYLTNMSANILSSQGLT